MTFTETTNRILSDVADTVLKHNDLLQHVCYNGVHPLYNYDSPVWTGWGTLCEIHFDTMYFILLMQGEDAWFVIIDNNKG